MAQDARLDMASWRNELRLFRIRLVGFDLSTGSDRLRSQHRVQRDTPGAPLIELGQVTTTAAQGWKVDQVEWTNGVPTTTIVGRWNKATMSSTAPEFFSGEIGDDTRLWWQLQIDGVTRLYGHWWVLASGMDTDSAPGGRPVGYGRSDRAPKVMDGATAVYGGDSVTVVLDGSTLIAPMVAEAKAASTSAIGAAGTAVDAAAEASAAALVTGALPGGPCATAASANIALTGIQDIAGVTGTNGQRTMLPAQADPAQNGPWIMRSGPWERPTDFNPASGAVQGAFCLVTGGANAGGYVLTTPDPIAIGTTPLNWVRASGVENFPTLNVTRGVGPSYSRTLLHMPRSTGMVNSAGKDDGTNFKILVTGGAHPNGPTGERTYSNNVFSIGPNMADGPAYGENPTLPAARYAIETKFAQGGDNSPFITEFHTSIFPAGQPANEYRTFSATIPHDPAEWATSAEANTYMRGNMHAWANGAGHYRIQADLRGGGAVYYQDGGSGGGHPQLLFDTNNRPLLQQMNASGDALLTLPFITAQDALLISQPLRQVGGAAMNPSLGATSMMAAVCTVGLTDGGYMLGLEYGGAQIDGDVSAASFVCRVTGALESNVQNRAPGGKSGTRLTSRAGTMYRTFNDTEHGRNIGLTYYPGSGGYLALDDAHQGGQGALKESFRIDLDTFQTRFTQAPRLPSFAFVNLPSASTAGAGAVAYCTSLAVASPGTVASGGGGRGQVISDGSAWRVVAAW